MLLVKILHRYSIMLEDTHWVYLWRPMGSGIISYKSVVLLSSACTLEHLWSCYTYLMIRPHSGTWSVAGLHSVIFWLLGDSSVQTILRIPDLINLVVIKKLILEIQYCRGVLNSGVAVQFLDILTKTLLLKLSLSLWFFI